MKLKPDIRFQMPGKRSLTLGGAFLALPFDTVGPRGARGYFLVEQFKVLQGTTILLGAHVNLTLTRPD